MESNPIQLKSLIYTVLFALVIVTFVILKPILWSETYLVVCDVGQGDAVYIHQSDGVDILIDAGPDDSVLECLGKSMTFTDRHIDMVFISHPHFDHYGGLASVLDHYAVETVYMSAAVTKSTSLTKLLTRIRSESQLSIVSSGTQVSVGDDGSMSILWPDQKYIQRNSTRKSDDADFRMTTRNPNDFSLVQLYTYGMANVLFTGDIPKEILLPIAESLRSFTIDILKVSHHGSITGLSEELLRLLQPHKAVISVAQKNRYKHPSTEVIDMLRAQNIPTWLTSESGTHTFTYKDGTWVPRYSCFLFFSC